MGQPATKDLGAPQYVCLNAPTTTPPTPPIPPTCPAGATSYGYPYPGWIADLSSFSPRAKWIWASQKSDGTPITGETTGAANAEFSFKTRFYLCGASPKDGTIWVAADDTVEVFLNGVSIPLTLIPNSPVYKGTVHAATLNPGPNYNVVEIKVKNGPSPSDCPTDQYKCNPAGVIFVGQFGDELKVADPTCKKPVGKIGDVDTLGLCPTRRWVPSLTPVYAFWAMPLGKTPAHARNPLLQPSIASEIMGKV